MPSQYDQRRVLSDGAAKDRFGSWPALDERIHVVHVDAGACAVAEPMQRLVSELRLDLELCCRFDAVRMGRGDRGQVAVRRGLERVENR